MKTTLEADDRTMPFGTRVGFVMLPVFIAVVALGAGDFRLRGDSPCQGVLRP